MTVASNLSSAIPFLRRYARALCGSQEHGDAAVLSTLERLVQEGTTGVTTKRDLFACFSRFWNETPQADRATVGVTVVEQNLGALSPMARQAFLLSALEGFSNEDLAAILAVDEAVIIGLLEKAGQEIASQIRTSVLIVEDERMVALDIGRTVEALGHEVVSIARTEQEAIDAFTQHEPGLVLCDIQLADRSSGIDAIDTILGKFDVPVIFVTAYPDRLLTGRRPEPTYLLEKPTDPASLKALVSQALFFHESG